MFLQKPSAIFLFQSMISRDKISVHLLISLQVCSASQAKWRIDAKTFIRSILSLRILVLNIFLILRFGSLMNCYPLNVNGTTADSVSSKIFLLLMPEPSLSFATQGRSSSRTTITAPSQSLQFILAKTEDTLSQHQQSGWLMVNSQYESLIRLLYEVSTLLHTASN